MRRSTQWFIFGAMWLCLALVTYFSRAMAEQRAFWYGTYDMSTLELAILYYGLYVISIASALGITCFFVGLSKTGFITVTVKEEPATEKELHQTPTVEKATTDTRNKASQRVLEKTGFKREGTIRKAGFVRGHWQDDYLYSIIREEWKQPRILKT
jgi:hypothetical protein